MDKESINPEKATEVVKKYFERIMGVEKKLYERSMLDWMDFTVNSVREENGAHVVKCEFKENIFSEVRKRYVVKVNKDGEIVEVERENELS